MDIAAVIRGKQLLRAGQARELRLEAGLSQPIIARSVGCSPGAISLWERGEREPAGQAGVRYLETLALIERLLLVPTPETREAAEAAKLYGPREEKNHDDSSTLAGHAH